MTEETEPTVNCMDVQTAKAGDMDTLAEYIALATRLSTERVESSMIAQQSPLYYLLFRQELEGYQWLLPLFLNIEFDIANGAHQATVETYLGALSTAYTNQLGAIRGREMQEEAAIQRAGQDGVAQIEELEQKVRRYLIWKSLMSRGSNLDPDCNKQGLL